MRDQIYSGEVEFNYILRKPDTPSDVLVVAFPGAAGANFAAANRLGYTYILTVGSFKVNALFLRVPEELCRSNLVAIARDFKVERAIMELINTTREATGSTRVIVIGSSLGGWCAIYYGLKYGFDVIAGAPSYTRYIRSHIPYMAGGESQEDIAWCTALLPEVVKAAGERGYDRKFFVSWGKGERVWLLKDQGPQLIEDLTAAGIRHTLQLDDYANHSSLSVFFPQSLKRQLASYLGHEAVADEENTLSAGTTAAKAYNDWLAPLRALTGGLAQATPNMRIRDRWQYGSENTARQQRIFAAATHNFPPEQENAAETGYAARLRHALLPVKEDFPRTAFVHQQTVLNYYKAAGDPAAFAYVADAVSQYLGKPEDLRLAAVTHFPYAYCIAAIRRLHFFLDFLGVVAEKRPQTSLPFGELLSADIEATLQYLLLVEILPASVAYTYDMPLAILHAAVYYRNHTEFFNSAHKAMLRILLAATDYFFDKNGVCILEQTKKQHELLTTLRRIVNFIAANEFPDLPEFARLKRKLEAIEHATALLTRPGGRHPNLGHSDVAPGHIQPRRGNFLKPESNIAILSEGLAYITVHSGSNSHAIVKHRDLLSFTFRYDGRQLVHDAGGGINNLSDYALSAVAHSALLCDEKDYDMPEYFDFTAIENTVEGEGYVLIAARHDLYSGVTLTRHLLWCKPNVIIVHDRAQSDTEHEYTQNFLFPRRPGNYADTTRIVLNIAQGFTLTVSQLPPAADDSGFTLERHSGTTAPGAPQDQLRGSRIIKFTKLGKLNNLAYKKRGTTACFLTVLEARSGKEGEASVVAAAATDGILHAELSNGLVVREELAV